jgi:hypothetical protein
MLTIKARLAFVVWKTLPSQANATKLHNLQADKNQLWKQPSTSIVVGRQRLGHAQAQVKMRSMQNTHKM